MKNCMKMTLPCKRESQNVIIFAVIAFTEQLNPNDKELDEIKTAVVEAVDNCISFAYPKGEGKIYVSCEIFKDKVISIFIKDKGVGIQDLEKAKQPLYSTTRSRSGLGINVMEVFMDTKIKSVVEKGTTVNLKRRIGRPFRTYNLKD